MTGEVSVAGDDNRKKGASLPQCPPLRGRRGHATLSPASKASGAPGRHAPP